MILIVLVIIVLMFYFRHRREQLMHETTRSMIEKGVPITPELIAELRASTKARDYQKRTFRTGVILTAIGAILEISHRHEGAGTIILIIGVVYLIVWMLEDKDKDQGAGQLPKQ
jgi:hypothetical protein